MVSSNILVPTGIFKLLRNYENLIYDSNRRKIDIFGIKKSIIGRYFIPNQFHHVFLILIDENNTVGRYLYHQWRTYSKSTWCRYFTYIPTYIVDNDLKV